LVRIFERIAENWWQEVNAIFPAALRLAAPALIG
jgi:hypothetical protein